MNRKEISVIVALFVFVVGVFLLSTFSSGDFSTENNAFFEKKQDSEIDINEIKSKMNEMTVEEIEETISKINQEIKRLESQLN
jgi:uncharacterized small protein (DUF1192 family)